MPKLDGTGMEKMPGKEAAQAFEDAAPQSSKGSGQGEGGTGGENKTGRTSPVHGSK